jgi:Ca2+-binding RTX toxin-like protein
MQNYINSLLSDIAYIENPSNALNYTDAEKREISAAEMNYFNSNFEIKEQSNNHLSGFSATTFQAKNDILFNGQVIYKKGSIIIANRGTEPSNFGNDFITDGLSLIDSTIAAFILNTSPLALDALFTEGLIFGTIRDLLGKVLGSDKLYSTNQTQDADRYLKDVYARYSINDPNLKLSVTGHSLGGHLAFSSAISNPSMVASSYTYNAAGIDFVSTLFLKFRTSIIENYGESPTRLEYINNILGLDNLSNLLKNSFGFFNDVGIQFTTLEGLLRHPENRISMVTRDMTDKNWFLNGMDNHSVKYLREISLVYEIFSLFIPKETEKYGHYNKITNILNNFKVETYAAQNINNFSSDVLINLALEHIVKYTGNRLPPVKSNSINILFELDNLNISGSMVTDYNKINANTTDSQKNAANIYALINLVPFVIYSDAADFSDVTYKGSSYNQEFLNEREVFLNKFLYDKNRKYPDYLKNIVEFFAPEDQSTYTLFNKTTIVNIITASGTKRTYIDLVNKTIIFENTNRTEFISDKTIKLSIFLSNINNDLSLNNEDSKVFDNFGNDTISVYNKNAEIYLTLGNDHIIVYMKNGGSLSKLEIQDNGLGDIIETHATDNIDNIIGTKYNDIIIGLDQGDTLNGGLGDDQIYGDLHMSSISNYAGPILLGNDTINGGDGDDIIYGGTGSDIINGDNGNDLIYGNYNNFENNALTDDNILSDKNYINVINGGQGVDFIYGGEGKDIINKVGTNDMSYINLTNEQFNLIKNESTIETLFGDRITGGKGDDEIYGTQYGDSYYYNSGDGNDDIYERRSGVGTKEFIDRIYIKNSFSNFSFAHNNTGNLTMTDNTTNQSVVFHDFMNLKYIEEFVFYNNTTKSIYDYNAILNIVLTRTAQNVNGIGVLNGNDLMDLSHTEKLNGISNVTNNINGGYGRDIITGGNLKDIINRSSSNSILDSSKNYGDDITGGKGDDEIYGTNYGDTYNYRLGDGFDTIYETNTGDPTSENFIDRIVFNASILATYISFKQFNSNVIVLYNNIEILQLVDFMRYKGIEQMCFSDGRFWDKYEILGRIPEINPEDPTKINGTDYGETLNGTDGNDEIHGGNGDDIINGGKGDDNLFGDAGNDTINGGLGNDEIHGGFGDDILNGNEGSDTINGDDGVDTINGGTGIDFLFGGNGNDIIVGGSTNANEVDTIDGGDGNDTINKAQSYTGDIIIGGKGNDEIFSASGADKYHYSDGDGHDIIMETDSNISYFDILYLHGISQSDVEIYRKGNNLNDVYIDIKNGQGSILLKNYYSNSNTLNYLDQIVFDSGNSWDKAEIAEKAKNYNGTESVDYITVTTPLSNIIHAGSGEDTIIVQVGNTIVNGGNDKDSITSYGDNVTINGDSGGDVITVNGYYNRGSGTINGGTGDDTITILGITGNSNYVIDGGDGNDKIYLARGDHTLVYNKDEGKDTVFIKSESTLQNTNFIFNGVSINKDILQLAGQGTDLILKFSNDNYVTLDGFFDSKFNINSIKNFIYNGQSISNIDLKNMATDITKVENNGVFYDTVWSDKITGTDLDDIVYLNGQTDDISNLELRDVVNTGNGEDTISIRGGNAKISAGNDKDTITSYGNNVEINGDGGNDIITLNTAYNVGSGIVNGGAGDDTITIVDNSSVSSYIIDGGKGDDKIYLARGKHTIAYNNNDGGDTIFIRGPLTIQETYIKMNGVATVNTNLLQLADQGRSLIFKFDENNYVKLKDFFDGYSSIYAIKGFIFNGQTMSTNTLKNMATNIIKAEDNGAFYDTIWTDNITGTDDGESFYLSGKTEKVLDLAYRDILNAGGGDDKIFINGGNAIVTAGNGDDIITSYGKNVEIQGDNGDDKITLNTYYDNGNGVVNGGNGDDTITIVGIDKSNYVINGDSGNDKIYLEKGSHTLIYNSGDGNDEIFTIGQSTLQNTTFILNGVLFDKEFITLENYGKDILFKFDNNNSVTLKDYLTSKNHSNIIKSFIFNGVTLSSNELIEIATTIKGTEGDDIIYDTIWNDKITLIGGNDRVYLRNGNDVLTTSYNDSTIYTSSGTNIINSGSGNDIFSFTNRSNTLNLSNNSGNDTLKFEYTPSTALLNINMNANFSGVSITDMVNGIIKLGWGNNSLKINQSDFNKSSLNFNGNVSNNILDFKYKLVGDNNGNTLTALSSDNTTIYGNEGDDKITGGLGNDILYGGAGNDTLMTGGGADIVYGGSGDDTIYGGNNYDNSYYGGDGNDIYQMSSGLGTIYDSSGFNKLYLSYRVLDNLQLVDNGSGFDIVKNGINQISYHGTLSRFEINYYHPNGHSYQRSLVGDQMNRLFELQSALQSETDVDKIKSMNQSINELWNYDQA